MQNDTTMKILTLSDQKGKVLEDFFPVERRGRPQYWSNSTMTYIDATFVRAMCGGEEVGGDKAYDSDKHDQELAAKGIELIAPHHKNRTAPRTQDGRKLKAYKKRWVVERFFAWIKPARPLLTRFDKKIPVFQAFLDLFAALTLINDL